MTITQEQKIRKIEQCENRALDMQKDFSPNGFWTFEVQHKAERIGEYGSTVRDEVLVVLDMAADVMARYDLLRKNLSEMPKSIAAVEARMMWDEEKEFEKFLEHVQRTEMKILWLNRMCKKLTGKYFFTGRLSKDDSPFAFAVEDMFALCVCVFNCI